MPSLTSLRGVDADLSTGLRDGQPKPRAPQAKELHHVAQAEGRRVYKAQCLGTDSRAVRHSHTIREFFSLVQVALVHVSDLFCQITYLNSVVMPDEESSDEEDEDEEEDEEADRPETNGTATANGGDVDEDDPGPDEDEEDSEPQ